MSRKRAFVRTFEQGRLVLRHKDCQLGFVLTSPDCPTLNKAMLRRAVKHHAEHLCLLDPFTGQKQDDLSAALIPATEEEAAIAGMLRNLPDAKS